MRVRLTRLIAPFVAVLFLAACGGSGGGSSGTAASGGSAGGNEPYTVRFGSVGGLTDAGLYIAQSRGYFKQENLTVQFSRMAGGSALTTAIATRNLDVAGIAVTAGMFNAVDQGLGLRIVGDKQSVRPGVAATHFVAQQKYIGASVADTLHNLRGKTVAITDKTSASAPILDWLLNKYGMSLSDVNLRALGYPEITASLLNGSLDAAVELEPFLSQALASGHVVDVSDQTEVLPATGATTVPLVYSSSFIADHKSAAQRFMVAYMKGVRDYNDAMFKNVKKQQIVSVIAQGSGQPEAVVDKAHPAGLDPNQQVSVKFLGQLEDWFQKIGSVKNHVDPSTIVDDSFAKFAVDKLGQFKP
ncbi:MAG: NMT1/THI5-like protein [Streptosporangiaceae bacterium]|nr:NMT1/THI5-like protein [Streptosporangiaceae bacterium]